jgi:hypothetical protein
LRAGGRSLALGESAASRALAFGFAALAALWFVLEVFIVKEVLFPCCENEFRSAVYTRKGSILKLRHGLYPRQPELLVRICDSGADSPAIGLLDFPA